MCGAPDVRAFLGIEERNYWRCNRCEATFLEPAQWPSTEAEYTHYLHHDNDPADERYRRFLSKLATPLLERLAPSQDGLDYGCGPGPALAGMLREAGHRVHLFDPFFFPGSVQLDRTYDFITCTEAAEHFHRPAREFACFDRMLRPGGWLAIMTCFQTDDDRFARWHYRRDPTHVVFYREATLRHIADRYRWLCEIPVKDVALMRKPVR